MMCDLCFCYLQSKVFFCVLLCDGQSSAATRRDSGEVQENKFYCTHRSREGSDGLPYRVTGKAPEFGFYLQAEDKKKGKAEARTILQFLWERQGRSG